MTENKNPVVYAGIIDEIGRRQYSGNVTWIREYIQNAIDSGSPHLDIKIHGNDLEIIDYGKGMDSNTIIEEAFSIGKSFKGEGQIGELGIGMYAGSGICDTILVRTKMIEKNIVIATIDMRKYREIMSKDPQTTFQEMMALIFKVEQDTKNDSRTSFTHIRFQGLSRDTTTLIEQTDLKKFLEYTVNLPVSETFSHKASLSSFLGMDSKEIPITLDINGSITMVKKFESKSLTLTDTFWAKEIVNESGVVIGKIWAVYNKSGTSLDDARILVKRKGLTVGTESVIEGQFFAKFSPRFFGEIILLDDRIEINTSRDWFVSSSYLSIFVKKTRGLLNELWGIADFDSKNGVGVINLFNSNARLNRRVKSNEKNSKKIGLAIEEREKIQKNEEKISEKITSAQEFIAKAKRGEINNNDPTNKMKLELIKRTMDNSNVKKYLKHEQHITKRIPFKTKRRNCCPTQSPFCAKDELNP